MDARQPTDQVITSELPAWIRASRHAINTIVGGTGLGVTNLDVAGGTTSLSVGTDLLAVGHETIIVTGLGAAELATILGGIDGQIKTFIFQDNNVDMRDGPKAGGQFWLEQLPALGLFEPDTDWVMCLTNVGGDGAGDHGYWKEVYRVESVR